MGCSSCPQTRPVETCAGIVRSELEGDQPLWNKNKKEKEAGCNFRDLNRDKVWRHGQQAEKSGKDLTIIQLLKKKKKKFRNKFIESSLEGMDR